MTLSQATIRQTFDPGFTLVLQWDGKICEWYWTRKGVMQCPSTPVYEHKAREFEIAFQDMDKEKLRKCLQYFATGIQVKLGWLAAP